MAILKGVEDIEPPMAPHDALHHGMPTTLAPTIHPALMDRTDLLRVGSDLGVSAVTCAVLLVLRLLSYGFVKRCIIRLPSDATFRDEAGDRFIQILAEA